MSAFADPEIIRLASTKFIPCTADDWYQRRRDDAEGRFFIAMANQGPRKGENGATRQGIYCLTADGELLEFKNAGQSVEATKNQLQAALRKFQALPDSRRLPGKVTVPDHGPVDRRYVRVPPEGTTLIRVHARILNAAKDGVEKGSCDFTGGDRASRDMLWLLESERTAIANAGRTVGHSFAVPASLAMRIARFHLIDNTRGEPDLWMRKDIQKNEMTLTVETMTDRTVTYRWDGRFLIANDPNSDRATRGLEGTVFGRLSLDRKTGTVTSLDLAVRGDSWGCSTFTQKGVRPGKSLLGIAFQLSDGKQPADRVAPQGARDLNSYLRP